MYRRAVLTQRVLVKALRPEERLEPQPKHVERRHARGDQANDPQQLAQRAVAVREGSIEDLVL